MALCQVFLRSTPVRRPVMTKTRHTFSLLVPLSRLNVQEACKIHSAIHPVCVFPFTLLLQPLCLLLFNEEDHTEWRDFNITWNLFFPLSASVANKPSRYKWVRAIRVFTHWWKKRLLILIDLISVRDFKAESEIKPQSSVLRERGFPRIREQLTSKCALAIASDATWIKYQA